MHVLDRLTSRGLLRTSVRRYAMQVLDEMGHAPLMDSTTRSGPRTAAMGLDPVRILVFGGGTAVGHGVTSWHDAVDGPLVRAVAERTGRGVTLENRAVQHVRARDAVDSLGLAGAHTYHLAVWSPSCAECLRLFRVGAWRRDGAGMISDLRRDRDLPVILMHVPEPRGHPWATALARPWVQHLNRSLDRVTARHREVTTATCEPFTAAEVGEPVVDAAYFRAVASRLLPVVFDALHLPSGHPDARSTAV